MSRRQRRSLSRAAREDSDAVFLFLLLLLLGSPRSELYSVTTISLLSPFSSPRRCEYFSTDAQSVFAAVHLHFIMLGEMSLWAFLRMAVKRMGMLPHCFVMRRDGVPLSSSANPILRESWGKCEEVRCVFVCWGLLCDSGTGRGT